MAYNKITLGRVDPRDIRPEEFVIGNNKSDWAVFADTDRRGSPLRCTKHNEGWCGDIASVIQSNLDAEQLWKSDIGESLFIPLMPTNDLFEMVLIEYLYENDQNLLKLFASSSEYDVLENEQEFIGFLSPGEGRLAVRQMLLNHFEVRTADIDRCSFAGHGLFAESIWQDNLKNTKLAFLDKYYVLKEGKCPHCLKKHAVRNDNRDLIPGTPESDRVYHEFPGGTPRQRNRKPAKNFNPITSLPNKDEKLNAIFDP